MPTSRRWMLPAAAIVLLAVSLRTPVSSLGVVLEPVRDSLDMSAGAAGFLTTLPVLSFAVFGGVTGLIVQRVGLDRTATLVLVVVGLAMVARTQVGSTAPFLLLTAVVLAGAAVGNVVLPPLARHHLPDHVTTISAVYGATIVGGAALSAALTVPIAEASGGWRTGLGVWAVLPAVALAVWVPLLVRGSRRPVEVTGPGAPRASMARRPLAWFMALFFAVQSIQAYVQFGWYAAMLDDAGSTPAAAGALLALLAAIGIPIALTLPAVSRRFGDTVLLPWVFGLATVLGWSSILLVGDTAPWVSAVLLGIGSGAFPWCLAMIGRRATTVAGTAALSASTQGFGYGLAALGPFGVGLVHELTGSFTPSIVVLAATGVLLGVLGTAILRADPL